jgi:hypothetical protein
MTVECTLSVARLFVAGTGVAHHDTGGLGSESCDSLIATGIAVVLLAHTHPVAAYLRQADAER